MLYLHILHGWGINYLKVTWNIPYGTDWMVLNHIFLYFLIAQFHKVSYDH